MANWKKSFQIGKELVLATCSKKSFPNANIVVSLGLVSENKLLVADCQMKTTIKNLLSNPEIVVVSGYFRIRGKVTILKTGEYFDLAVGKSKGYKVRHAILITIKEVVDLDNGKKLF